VVSSLTCHVFCADNQLHNSDNKTDSAADESKVPSKPAASCRCGFATPSPTKFIWPGIDAIIEAYASHVEGADSCQCL